MFSTDPKYKVGDVVYYKLDAPLNALGHKQSTSNFRMGDYRFSKIPKKITHLIYMQSEPYYRYLLEGMNHVSYSENELTKATKQKESKFEIKHIIKKKKLNNEFYYLVWWKGEKKGEASWEKMTKLQEDDIDPEEMLYNYKHQTDL
jgi:hypothetical protein